MRNRFAKYERSAGLFVLVAFIGAAASLIGIALSKGWFESKVRFYTILETAEGVRVGTAVEMAGVPVGSVEAIGFDDAKEIRVTIAVYKRFLSRVRASSRIQVIRPYVIGEKVLYLTMGSGEDRLAAEGSLLAAEEVVGLTDILNGRKLIPYMETLNGAAAGLKDLADLMLKSHGSVNFVKTLEGIYPLLVQMKLMSAEVTKVGRQLGNGQELGKVVRNLASLTDELNRLGPQLSGKGPGISKDLSAIVSNLAILTEEFKSILPAIAAVAPELPKSSRRMIEAIDNAVIVLKAMQRSFLLSGSAREVREEESKQLEKDRVKRTPATDEPKPSDSP